jgi:hypothetical protein
MSDLRVKTIDDRVAFEPGEELTGAVYWKLQSPPERLDLRLFWFTRGKGTEDAAVVEEMPLDRPLAEEARPFRFRLPEGPYSFSGKLISLIWALELVAKPSKEVARVELTVAPGGREMRLEALPEDRSRNPFIGWSRVG